MITKLFIDLLKWIIVYSILFITELFIPDFNYLGWKLWRTTLCYWLRTCAKCIKPYSGKFLDGDYLIHSQICKECNKDMEARYGVCR